jgi:uncharacterized protein (DUF3820 family)
MKSKQMPKIKARTDRLTFGKYKGKSIQYILDTEPGYIVWLEEENVLEMPEDIYREAQELDYDEYGLDLGSWYDWGIDISD